MQYVSRNIVGRLFASLAAFALLLAGVSVVAPSPAKAQTELIALIIGLTVTTAVVVTTVVLEEDEEEPASP